MASRARNSSLRAADTWNKWRPTDVSRTRSFIQKRRMSVMSGSSRFSQLTSAQTGASSGVYTLEKRLNEIGARASTNSRHIARRPRRRDCFGAVQLGGPFPPRRKYGRRSISGTRQRCSEAWNNSPQSVIERRIVGHRPLVAVAVALGVGIGGYGRVYVVKARGDDAMNKNRVERTSANDLTAQVQENASELVRSSASCRKVH